MRFHESWERNWFSSHLNDQIIALWHSKTYIIQYMDIFNQFSMIQLERIENLIQQHLTKIKRNDKVMKVKKSLLEDLLIYFKKIFTLFQSEW